MLVMLMADEIKIEYLRNERYSFFIWFFFGLVVAVSNAARNEWQAAAPVNAKVVAANPKNPPARLRSVSSQPAVATSSR
jgi:hypothetical protein